MTEHGMKPIWYFVGLILLVIGSLVFCSGIYQYFNPPIMKTVLIDQYMDIRQGVMMNTFGSGMFLKIQKQSV